jgi:hypothetical protein
MHSDKDKLDIKIIGLDANGEAISKFRVVHG